MMFNRQVDIENDGEAKKSKLWRRRLDKEIEKGKNVFPNPESCLYKVIARVSHCGYESVTLAFPFVTEVCAALYHAPRLLH